MLYYTLPTGTLALDIEHSEIEPNLLFDIGARENPKRAFLFVSKVLGKHYPVDTRTLLDIHQRLAAKLPAPDNKITLFIGMAETATALAQGVFEAWLAQHPSAQALYLHTSRLQALGYPLCEFEESHSHATRQLLHLPKDSFLRDLFLRAERLVLIDDELSTGRTFKQLHTALQAQLPQALEQHWLCLTDFCHVETPDITRHSLLKGSWTFHATREVFPAASASQSADAPKIVDSGYGRTGIARALHIAPEQLKRYIEKHHKNQRILVLGTGEYIHPPAVFARELANACGAQVFLQSSTRSPVMVWNIFQHKRTFADPYDEDVAYYLYNLPDLSAYNARYICHEHPANVALSACAKALNASLIQLKTI